MENIKTIIVDFKKLSEFLIQNYKDPNKIALVSPLRNELNLMESDFERIVRICNQPAIYDIIFRDKLEGKPYHLEKAKEFLTWGDTGWLEGKYFVYIIRENGKIVGAIDIKSNNPESAEVGYWQDTNTSGYMTNAVKELIEEARKAGYKSLVAFTKLTNEKSMNVLKRSGFKFIGKDYLRKEKEVMNKFIYQL